MASVIAVTVKQEQRRHVFLNGTTSIVLRDDPLHRVEAGGVHVGGLTAPMPGKIVALLATPGQCVGKGAPLLILEAMKMEHTITAPMNGTVKAFRYATGDQVVDGAEQVEFEVEPRWPAWVLLTAVSAENTNLILHNQGADNA